MSGRPLRILQHLFNGGRQGLFLILRRFHRRYALTGGGPPLPPQEHAETLLLEPTTDFGIAVACRCSQDALRPIHHAFSLCR
ncbi:MAG: hypothetical protein ACYDEO_25575 [Aggregatilineales bacterium]